MKALNLYGKQDVRYEETEMPLTENEDDVIIKVKEPVYAAQIYHDSEK